MKTLHGNIVIKEDIPLSSDDYVSTRIEDVSLMDVAAILIRPEKDLVSNTVRCSPIAFSIVSSFAIRKEKSYCGSQTLILQCLLVEVPPTMLTSTSSVWQSEKGKLQMDACEKEKGTVV
jgi:hypothetical protein